MPWGITWTPSSVNARTLIGLFAYLQASNLPGITSLTIRASSNNQSYDFENCPNLQSISFPILTNVTGLSPNGFGVLINVCPVLTSISFPALSSIPTPFAIGSCAITTFLLPSLVTQSADLTISSHSSLTTFTAANWLPGNGTNISFVNCALLAASVNHVLARGVANPAFVSGTLSLNGGTNAAPTGQGIADKATLIGRGVTVTTN